MIGISQALILYPSAVSIRSATRSVTNFTLPCLMFLRVLVDMFARIANVLSNCPVAVHSLMYGMRETAATPSLSLVPDDRSPVGGSLKNRASRSRFLYNSLLVLLSFLISVFTSAIDRRTAISSCSAACLMSSLAIVIY